MRAAHFVQSDQEFWYNLPIPSGSTVCIVDSSFNPPNNAHLRLAQLCQEAFQNCYVLFTLAIGNADKPKSSVDQLQCRIDMIQALISSEFPDNRKVGWALITAAKFIDKAAVVKKHIANANIVFAMGFDTLIRLGYQKFYNRPLNEVLDEFFGAVQVLTLTRSTDPISGTPSVGQTDNQIQCLRDSQLFGRFASRIVCCLSGKDTEGVSSSSARRSVTDLQQMVPAKVCDYVLEHNLYGLK